MKPRISLIMPVRDEGANLRRSVDSLLRNTGYGDWELLVLDDASGDGCTGFLEEAPYRGDRRLRLLTSSRPLGHVRQRNRGAERATGELLMFLDGHHAFTPYWLSNLQLALERRAYRGIVGPVLAALDEESWQPKWALNWGWTATPDLTDSHQNRRGDLGPDCRVHWLGGCQMLMTAELYRRLGGLCEEFQGHGTDDTDLCLRAWVAGHECRVEPSAVLGHLYKDHFVNPVTWADLTANHLLLVHLNRSPERLDERLRRPLHPHGHEEGVRLFETVRPRVQELRSRIQALRRRPLADLLEASPTLRAGGSDPSHSIVVASHGEGDNLRRTVDSIRDRSGPDPYELVLVDDGSSDGSFDFLREPPYRDDGRIRTLRLPTRRGCIVARDEGARASTGEHLVFMDAHMAVTDGWLRGFRERAARYGPDAALSPEIVPLEEEAWEPRAGAARVIGLDADLEFRWGGLEHFGALLQTVVGCCIALPAGLYERCGGFDTGLRRWGCEFVDLVAKVYAAGGTCMHVSGIRVGHLFRRAFPYEISFADVVYNKLRVGYMHLPPEGFRRLRARLAGSPGYEAAIAALRRDLPELRRRRRRRAPARPEDWWARVFPTALTPDRCPEPYCDGEPEEGARFCPQCGTALDGELSEAGSRPADEPTPGRCATGAPA